MCKLLSVLDVSRREMVHHLGMVDIHLKSLRYFGNSTGELNRNPKKDKEVNELITVDVCDGLPSPLGV